MQYTRGTSAGYIKKGKKYMASAAAAIASAWIHYAAEKYCEIFCIINPQLIF